MAVHRADYSGRSRVWDRSFNRPTIGLGLAVRRPPLRAGLVVSLGTVTLATAAIYPLKSVAPVVSLSVVYLPAVLIVVGLLGAGARALHVAARVPPRSTSSTCRRLAVHDRR